MYTVTGLMGRHTASANKDEEDAEMYVDTAANGSIMKKQYAGVTDMVEKTNRKVVGVTGSSIKITHTAVSDKIGNVHIVPEASANLLSVPMLMRQGCTLGAKGDDLWVTDARGKMKSRAKLNKSGMYMVRLSEISVSSSSSDDSGSEDEHVDVSEDIDTVDDHELKMGNTVKRKIRALIAGGNTLYWKGNRMWVSDKHNTYKHSAVSDSDAVYATMVKGVHRGQMYADMYAH